MVEDFPARLSCDGDMELSGNVAERCARAYRAYPAGDAIDPAAIWPRRTGRFAGAREDTTTAPSGRGTADTTRPDTTFLSVSGWLSTGRGRRS